MSVPLNGKMMRSAGQGVSIDGPGLSDIAHVVQCGDVHLGARVNAAHNLLVLGGAAVQISLIPGRWPQDRDVLQRARRLYGYGARSRRRWIFRLEIYSQVSKSFMCRRSTNLAAGSATTGAAAGFIDLHEPRVNDRSRRRWFVERIGRERSSKEDVEDSVRASRRRHGSAPQMRAGKGVDARTPEASPHGLRTRGARAAEGEEGSGMTRAKLQVYEAFELRPRVYTPVGLAHKIENEQERRWEGRQWWGKEKKRRRGINQPSINHAMMERSLN
ncbi:hypothetical protein B0H10DRAFT_2203590 [Mycena sp. CBHHK59/15]|nr:hypothetical protein B0H10DRAFT_2203590 [Mycena sp. CBHHK59/15]